jgi:acetoin utilization protein AcuB
MLVGQQMTRDLITATPHTSHRDALDLIRQHNIRRLPVVEGGQLVGIVSEKDLLSNAPSQATTLSIYEIHTLLDRLTLDKIMSRPVVTIAPDCPLEDAAAIMRERKIGCLPVLENGALVGIITESDCLRLISTMLGAGQPGARWQLRVNDQPGIWSRVAGAVTEAGGDIITAMTVDAGFGGVAEFTIREHGADADKLRALLKVIGATIVNVQDGRPHAPKLVG